MNKSYQLLFFILVFILQLTVSRFINLGPFIFICFVPMIISTIPLTDSPQRVMFVSFVFALLFDILSDGVIGLNAATAVFVALLRKPMYMWLANADRQDKTYIASIHTLGFSKYFKYITGVVALYMLVYILFDCMTFRNFGFIVLKFLISTAVNLGLSVLISSSFINRR